MMNKLLFPFFRCLLLSFLCFMSQHALAADDVTVTTYTYAEKDGQELKLDVYVDSTYQHEGTRPVMIFSFGGSWKHGSREVGKSMLTDFAQHGFVAVGIDYRLGIKQIEDSGVKIDASNFGESYAKAITMGIEDLVDATSFLIQKADEWELDTARFVACGSSAGAINTATAEYLICNRHPLVAGRLPESFNYRAIVPCAGGIWMMGTDTLTWERKPCMFIDFHGTRDQLVPYGKMAMGKLFAAFGPEYYIPQLKAMEVPYSQHIYDGADHVIALIYDNPFARQDILSFLRRTIDRKERLMQVVHEENYGTAPSLRSFLDTLRGMGFQK